jgi:CTP:molybdopterin cytidylyltransferase MocA
MTADAIRTIAESDSEICMGTLDGVTGHPVKFARKHWPAIIESAQGDVGARNFLKGRSDITLIDLSGVADLKDLDTEKDVESFLERDSL